MLAAFCVTISSNCCCRNCYRIRFRTVIAGPGDGLTVLPHGSDFSCYHAHFLKVDESVDFCVISEVQKCEIFLYDGDEGNEWRNFIVLLQTSVLGHIARGVHETLHFVKLAACFLRQFFPRLF